MSFLNMRLTVFLEAHIMKSRFLVTTIDIGNFKFWGVCLRHTRWIEAHRVAQKSFLNLRLTVKSWGAHMKIYFLVTTFDIGVVRFWGACLRRTRRIEAYRGAQMSFLNMRLTVFSWGARMKSHFLVTTIDIPYRRELSPILEYNPTKWTTVGFTIFLVFMHSKNGQILMKNHT